MARQKCDVQLSILQSSKVLSLVLVHLVIHAYGYEPDRINRWSGQPAGHKFAQYGGYVTVNVTSGKQFYYTFVEANESADKRPLVLWLNGGPGCSSVFNGFFLEHGPWRLRNEYSNKLNYNKFSWNTEANIIYLESPVGVGFSYSKSQEDYVTGDEQTAVDNYLFMVGWLKKFPRYRNRPFFIAGESYAGHYVPQMALQIVLRNKFPSKYKVAVKVNLKGVLMGNPYFQGDTTTNELRALVQRYVVRNITAAKYITYCLTMETYNQKECYLAADTLYYETGNVDVYDLYGPVCTYEGGERTGNSFTRGKRFLPKGPFPRPERGLQEQGRRQLAMQPLVRKAIGHSTSQRITGQSATRQGNTGQGAPSTVPTPFSLTSPACNDHWVYRYMNQPRVQKVIHANVSGAINGSYSACSPFTDPVYANNPFTLQYVGQDATSLPVVKQLLSAKLKVWIYSGDADTICPTVGTLDNLRSLRLTVSDSWHPWYYYDQPGGWTQEYKEGLTFLPIRQPERALFMLKRFLAGIALPKDIFDLDTVHL